MKPGRQKKQKNKEQQQKGNPHTLTDYNGYYMIKNSLVYVAGECSSFLARRLGVSLEASPTSFYEAARKYPGHNNPASYTGCKIH